MFTSNFDEAWHQGKRAKPNIRVLAVRPPGAAESGPVVWILVELQEWCRFDERDGSVHEATVHLSYRQLAARGAYREPAKGDFCASYHKMWDTISLTSTSLTGGAVFVDPPKLRGNRLGTYLMNEIVQWAQRWPDATINGIKLLDGQAGDNNKERRNRFYEQFGLVFDYSSADRSAGLSRPMRAGDLTTVETWQQNITEHKFFDYLADVLYDKEEASMDLQHRTHACKELIAERRVNEARPMWWAIKTVYQQHSAAFAVSGMLIVVAVAGWWRIHA